MTKEFTKESFTLLRNDINAALKAVSEKHGIALSLGNISYNAQSFNTKLTGVIKDANLSDDISSNELLYRSNFIRNCFFYNLKESDLGKKFSSNGINFTLVGCNPRAHKSPLICKNEEGKLYKFTVEAVKPKITTQVA